GLGRVGAAPERRGGGPARRGQAPLPRRRRRRRTRSSLRGGRCASHAGSHPRAGAAHPADLGLRGPRARRARGGARPRDRPRAPGQPLPAGAHDPGGRPRAARRRAAPAGGSGRGSAASRPARRGRGDASGRARAARPRAGPGDAARKRVPERRLSRPPTPPGSLSSRRAAEGWMTVEFEPFEAAGRDDPYTTYRALRDEAPVHFAPRSQVWCVSRYEDVLAVLRDTESFSSRAMFSVLMNGGSDAAPPLSARMLWLSAQFAWRTRLNPLGFVRGRNLIASDPPQHDALRHIVNRGFGPRR